MASPSDPIPRLLAPRVREALADTPVVLIHGPRQSGKTTLARHAAVAGDLGLLDCVVAKVEAEIEARTQRN